MRRSVVTSRHRLGLMFAESRSPSVLRGSFRISFPITPSPPFSSGSEESCATYLSKTRVRKDQALLRSTSSQAGCTIKVAAFALGSENCPNVPLSRMDPRCTRPKTIPKDISEKAIMRVRGTRQPTVAADLLFPVPLCLSENPKSFRPTTYQGPPSLLFRTPAFATKD